MKINYLTTNELKFKIAQNYFKNLEGYELVQHTLETPEIQDASCEEVARYSAVYAAKKIGEPCVKMDVGFFINALGGFPGPFVKYVNDWLSEEKYMSLLENESNRSAYFLVATAIGFPDGRSKVFPRRFFGRVAELASYTPSAWPANSLFIPDGYNIPLGAMSQENQEEYWQDGVWSEVIEYLKGI